MKYIFISILILLSTKLVVAQEIIIYGTVKNTEGAVVESARLTFGQNIPDYTKSNQKGEYKFKVNVKELKTIKIEQVRYDTKTIYWSKRLARKVNNVRLELNIVLQDRVLKEVIVRKSPPKKVFGSKEYSIADFAIDKSENLILLTYLKKLEKGSSLKLLSQDKKRVVDTYIIKDRAVSFRIDFRKNIHLITTTNVYLVVVNYNKIQLYKENKDYYFKYIAPIIDTLNDNIYYSNYAENYPAFNYYQFNKTDSVYTNLLGVIDEPLMVQYRSEFKFSDIRTKLWAFQKELDTGIDREIWVGATIFSNSIYYTPLYAPLFVNNDTILVFDHYKNKLYRYNYNLSFKDSLKITYHEGEKKSGWEQPLIQDKISKKIYAVFNRSGYTYLSLINLNTGQILFSKRLYYRYIEKIKVINNQVFYIYRPFESIQKKYLYSETL